jgi:hypothetical protein
VDVGANASWQVLLISASFLGIACFHAHLGCVHSRWLIVGSFTNHHWFIAAFSKTESRLTKMERKLQPIYNALDSKNYKVIIDKPKGVAATPPPNETIAVWVERTMFLFAFMCYFDAPRTAVSAGGFEVCDLRLSKVPGQPAASDSQGSCFIP